jgi:phenylacetate-CoA ligase
MMRSPLVTDMPPQSQQPSDRQPQVRGKALPPIESVPTASPLTSTSLSPAPSPSNGSETTTTGKALHSSFAGDTALHGNRFGVDSLLHGLNRLALGSYLGFRERINFARHEDLTQRISRVLASREARRAYNTVPAYRKFIDDRADWQGIATLSDLPETDKNNYIKPSMESDRLDLYASRTIPPGSAWDTSTGTSGKPTSWYRGPAEVNQADRILSYRAQAILGKGAYSFINGFALGPWATGMTAARGVGKDSKSITYNTAAEPELMLQLIQESLELDPERPVVVGGYPPHMIELVKVAREQGVNLHDYQVIAVVGGEAMSELQRERMLIQRDESGNVTQTGFQEVFSFYGASDLDINIGFETPFEVALRRELTANPELARDLLGDNNPFVPMIFHYDPLTHHIEVNDKGQLIYTEVSGNRISPRIRYNLGDVGTVRLMSEVQEILEKHDVELPAEPLSKLPLVFVWGRIDDGVTYRGANLPWENVEETLQLLQLADQVKGFGIAQYEEDGETRTEFLLEVPDEAQYLALSDTGEELLGQMIQVLGRINRDFSEQIARVTEPQDLPRLRVYQGDSPMAEHSRENPARKQKHVFLGTDIEAVKRIESGGTEFEMKSL